MSVGWFRRGLFVCVTVCVTSSIGLLCGVPTAVAQDVVFYAASKGERQAFGESTLYTINPATAVATPVGPIEDDGEIGFENVSGMAFLSDGRLVASASNDADENNRTAILIEIDPSTGLSSLIGTIGRQNVPDSCGRAPDLTYDPTTSTLYATADKCFETSDQATLSIDPDTGAGTILSNVAYAGGGLALARQPSTGTFFVTEGGVGMLTLDPATGETTSVGLEPDGWPTGMDFHPLTGVLYATSSVDDDSSLVTLDTTDGTETVVDLIRDADGNLIDGFDALAISAPGGCTAAPVGPCKEPNLGKTWIQLRTTKGKKRWKWKGGNTQKSEFGDPLNDTGYRICLYDAMGANPVLVSGQRVPAGSEWTETDRGFQYKSESGEPDGITKLTLKDSSGGKGKIKTKGKRVELPKFPLANNPEVVSQLLNDEGVCWGSTFVRQPARNNLGGYTSRD
jgi:hypothetical protein